MTCRTAAMVPSRTTLDGSFGTPLLIDVSHDHNPPFSRLYSEIGYDRLSFWTNTQGQPTSSSVFQDGPRPPGTPEVLPDCVSRTGRVHSNNQLSIPMTDRSFQTHRGRRPVSWSTCSSDHYPKPFNPFPHILYVIEIIRKNGTNPKRSLEFLM